MFAGRVAQNHRVRLHARGGVGVAHIVHTGFEVERHGIADDGEILVVDGQRRLGEGGQRAGRAEAKDGSECFHGLFIGNKA